MENIIYNELIARDFNVDVGLVCVAGKDSAGKVVRKQIEVNFVCNKGPSAIMSNLLLQYLMKQK